MRRKGLSSADGEGFLRAFTDAWADLVKERELGFTLKVSPSNRKGVIRIELQAFGVDSMSDTRCVGKYSCEYPTAQVGSLEASLYQALIRLERVLDDASNYPGGRG